MRNPPRQVERCAVLGRSSSDGETAAPGSTLLAVHIKSTPLHDETSFAVERRAPGLFIVVIIIVVVGAESTSLRIHFHRVCLAVFRASCFQVSTVTRDLYVQPAFRL